MNNQRGFNEVMIVNPYEPGSETKQGVNVMRFYAAPQNMAQNMGYYAAAPEAYGYYAAAPEAYGYYAETPESYGYYAQAPAAYGEVEPGYNEYEPMGYYAEPEPRGYPMGYYAEPEPRGYPMGYYAEPEPRGYSTGYYAEPEPMGYYAEPEPRGYPMGYYAEPEPMGYYAEATEMPGYAEYDPMQPGVAGYAEYPEGYGGYVREVQPRYNAGCPMPTNVNGFGEAEVLPGVLQGYVRPSSPNPTCNQFTPQAGQEPPPPDNFKPLW